LGDKEVEEKEEEEEGEGSVSLLFFTLLNDEVVVTTVLFRVYILNVPVAVMRDILPP